VHPRKTILLSGVDNDLFWGGVCDGGFRALGVSDVFLAPGSALRIEDARNLCAVREFVLPYEAAVRSLESGTLVVYRVGGPRLRNITSSYQPVKEPEAGGFRIDLGSRAADPFLGRGWYDSSGGARWMSRRGLGWLPGPAPREGKLRLSGFCPALILEPGPLEVVVSVHGLPLRPEQLRQAGPFHLEFPLPAGFSEKNRIDFQIEVDRTYKSAPEARELGLSFGALEIR
jgi:hypothetical protein